MGTHHPAGSRGAAALALVLLGACASTAPSPATVDPRQAYAAAVRDASVATPDEISRDLVALVRSDDRLVWRTANGQDQVLVVTWTSWKGYDDKVGQTLPLGRETWVTVVPELKLFCRAQARLELPLRIEQLLGLPPGGGKDRFVELWVDPRDCFRPSADPEVTDHEAELELRPDTPWQTTSPAHAAWFSGLRSQSYGAGGYPWTRLGYTYDWANPARPLGLSEFVVRQGAPVEVRSVASTADYCR